MNALINLNQTAPTMSSREIAILTDKEHRNVCRDIENLNQEYEKLSLLKIEQCDYVADNGQTYREFKLTKEQTIDLITGYRADLRIRINRRWQELEQASQPKLPQTLPEALRLAADLAEQNQKQAQQIAQDRPKVLLAEAITASDDCILVGTLAKILKQNGIDIGQNRLFQWLKEHRYLRQDNTPTQRAMDLELFQLQERTITKTNGEIKNVFTVKVTGKGQSYFVQKFLEEQP